MAIRSNQQLTKNKKKRGNAIKLVMKSNELVEARYMFDIWETRFFLSLVAMINKNDEDDEVYRLWFKDIKHNFKLKSNTSYDYLREAAISMGGKSVHIGWKNKDIKRNKLHRIFKFVDYMEKGEEGKPGAQNQEFVDVAIDSDIKPYLLDIKKNFDPKTTRYTSYDLRNVIKLKPYGSRIYELLKQFEKVGSRILEVRELKDMFEIVDEYPRFSNFYQKVIKTSIDSINQHTDLRIPSVEKIKKGRSVVALRFIIETKPQKEVQIIMGDREPELFDSDDYKVDKTTIAETPVDYLYNTYQEVVVGKFGVTPVAYVRALEQGTYTEEEVKQAISVTHRANYNKEIKKNIAGYFLKALKEGYTDPKEEQQKRKKKEKAVLRKELMSLVQQRTKAINKKIGELIKADAGVRTRAIEVIKENVESFTALVEKETVLGRSLTIDDYRTDKDLAAMVINNIIDQQKDSFKDIYAVYGAKIKKAQAALNRVG